jgi:hypothetical protein
LIPLLLLTLTLYCNIYNKIEKGTEFQGLLEIPFEKIALAEKKTFNVIGTSVLILVPTFVIGSIIGINKIFDPFY